MFSSLGVVFIVFFSSSVTFSSGLYGPHPRIASENGHLIIHAADGKNVSLKTTTSGYINLNNENLIFLIKDARSASDSVKRISKNVIIPFTSTVTRLTNLIEGPDGLMQRIGILENNFTSIPATSRVVPRNRNIAALNRRVNNLEMKMGRIITLLNKNECASNPCKNGGQCQDIFNGYICHCPDTWEGPMCDVDVNECLRFVGTDLGCQNGATCVNKPGSYECLCPSGWYGIHCNRRTQDCNSGSPQELCGHGTCLAQNTGTGYKCICDPGWTTDGKNPACTVDVNECESQKPHCSVNPPVPCINVPGSFYCGSCPAGYTGTGYYCSDIDECLTYNGGCSINPKVQCINTPGSRICGSCPSGYIGDGITCSYRGICQVNNGGCHPLARCVENTNTGDNYVLCICPAGYVGLGIGSQGCTATDPGSYLNPCVSNPCVHGTCTSPSNATFTCTCNTGYTGKTCNVLVDSCNPNPCANNGKCTSTLNDYKCECTASWTGKNCDTERQACGGVLTEETGFLEYSSNSSKYVHSVSCPWLIETVPNKVLNITFTKFNLELSNNCQYEWLQIHDGPNSAAQEIGKFCGHESPKGGEIITTHNSVYMWFRSDHSVAMSGFALKWVTSKPVCGGNFFVQSHGTIKSPGSPGNYPPNRDCEWVLFAPLGKRLQFYFFTLNIGNNPNCSFDYLEIRSGVHAGELPLAQYCNTSHPEPLISTGSTVSIRFHSDETDTYAGFQISYSIVEGFPGCGGTFTTGSGEISSPVYEEQYPANMNCEYKIQSPENTRIKITFLSFSLEEGEKCQFDNVAVYEGGFSDSDLISRYCGSGIPPSYVSTGNQLYIKFTSDWTTHYDGFRLRYETVCGGILTEPTGVIDPPKYQLTFRKFRTCIYQIKQPLNTAIKVSFQSFKENATRTPTQCYYNFVEIRDGDNENSTLVGKFCKYDIPEEVISKYNYLWIKLKLDEWEGIPGFRANYSTMNLMCGGIANEDLGIIRSPLHRTAYPPETKCMWVISAPLGFVIQLTWITFHLELSYKCTSDHVTVFDNNTDPTLAGQIGKHCGNNLPPTTVSSSNVITIQFISDYTVNYEGFVIHYNFMDERTSCGGQYFAAAGVIRTPNYPSNYPLNKICTWIITVSSGHQIQLNVTDFKLEDSDFSDFLEIRNGAHATSPPFGKFSKQTIPKIIISHTNSLYLKFNSDGSYADRGFKIIWDGASIGCGATLDSPTGHIISPNYPQNYVENSQCMWKIATSAGSALYISIVDIDLEHSPQCTSDYLEIYEGLQASTSKSFGRYCTEGMHYKPITTVGNKALVKFRSDNTIHGRGFQLKYSTMCINVLKGYRGVVESPNFPNQYPIDQDCSWTIVAPEGNTINITFSHFDIETFSILQNKCDYDYVEIKEGEEQEELHEFLLEKYCGDTAPDLIASTQHIVNIHFVTDSLIHGSGFRLEWVINGCVDHLKRPEGRISTPGYPNGYPLNTKCEWLIDVNFETSIELTVKKFSFEKSNDCTFDSLEVFSGPDENSPPLTKICHSDKELVLTSTGNVMFIKFISDYAYGGKGFEATYKTVPIKCGGYYKAPQGSIHSSNYPKNFNYNEDCEWLIEVAMGHSVSLQFTEFDVVSLKNCTDTFVKIFDGRSTDAPPLLSNCGSVVPNETIHSTSNTMLVRMKSSNFITSKGFSASYITNCGARIVTDSSGVIDIADWGSWTCEWTVIADTPDKHVSLTITHMDLKINCNENPALIIYEGEDDTGPEIRRLCGTKVPPTIVSKGSAIHLSLNYALGSYLRASYSVITETCGGHLTSISGAFASPGYPNNYPMNIDCEWTLNLAPGNKLILTFSTFELISSENCNADYVEVREKSSAGKLIGIYCGADLPMNLTHANSLWIRFKSTDVGTAQGFLAEYELEHGNELTGVKGQIASPLYPLTSVKSMDIVSWRITVEFLNVIQIKFLDYSIDTDTGNGECYLHGIQIYDGYDDLSPELASHCSFTFPKPVTSSSNVVYITYYSTLHTDTIKFLLEWTQVQKPVTITDLLSKLPVDGCGSEEIVDLTLLLNYTLQSPGYPHGYAGNLNCEWIFSTVPQKHLKISFKAMDLESNSRCMLDAVNIYSGDEGKPNWSLMDTICLSNATMMSAIHTTNLMKVVFKTDRYVNKTGFSAYISTDCGGTLSGPRGVIEISNMTDNSRKYVRKLMCEWNITVKAGRTIQVTFLNIDIPNSEKDVCNNNYILLKNGRYPDSPLLGKGKYCGTTIPHLDPTTGNSMSIKYIAPLNVNGFKLEYKELSLSCGGHITLNNQMKSTNISSPNYPNIPPPHSECIWIISAPSGEILQLDFVERFDVAESTNCMKAGVELRDGGTMISHFIDVFCNDIPSTQKSTDNLMYIRFYTDVDDPRNGFKATVSIASCGGVIRGTAGRLNLFHSIPVKQPANQICTWKIVGPPDHYLTLNFTEFSLPYCTIGTRLNISENLQVGNETNLASLCGRKKPFPIKTTSNEVTVKLITVSTSFMRGFSLMFNASQETCGGNIEAESGYITSPGYPSTILYRRYCEWVITVPEKRRITVNIIDQDLQYFNIDQTLTFINGKTYHLPYITSIRNNNFKRVIKSSGNHMLVYFLSYSSNSRGFKLHFSSDEPTICTGNLNKYSGVIYPPTENDTTYMCQWVRKPQGEDYSVENQTLALTIDINAIGRKIIQNCEYAHSYIKVTTESEKTIIAKFCGLVTPVQVVRNPFPVTILEISQASYHERFNYTIMYKVHRCGGVLTSSSGEITSPTLPNQATETTDCAWSIKIEEGQTVKVNFTFMDMDTSCDRNYLEIHNGGLPSSPKIDRYCGKTPPSFIQTESNALWLEYRSSPGATGKGFKLTYEPTVSGCGGIFTDRARTIESPNYPNEYPNNAECLWEVRAVEGYHIGLQFVDRFHIEDSTNCTNDFVEIFDYRDDEWVSLARRCGREQQETFNSTATKMRILFRSNSQLTGTGFKARWHYNCGGTYSATKTPQYLVSPGYPTAYAKNLNCKYIIKALSKFINIIFEDFNLEEGNGASNCKYDNVTISRKSYFHPLYTSQSRHDLMYVTMRTYCGNNIPSPVRRSNELVVWFRSDAWLNRKGFKLKFFLDSCGGPVTEEGEIGSPVDPAGMQNYYGTLNCQWNITAPKNKIVVIKFSVFELEHHRDCAYDNIAIYNGNVINETQRLSLLCGNITYNLPVILSRTNSMIVVLKTDGSNHFKGFKATVLFMYGENVGCGGTIILTKDLPVKTLQSPDIDKSGQYEPDLDCHWQITAPEDETVELKFESFHLAVCVNATEGDPCTCDYLQIRDGGGPLSILAAQPCGHNLPLKVVSATNQLWVRMVTDGLTSSTGFRATVKKVPSPCGSSVLVVTEEQQALTSPFYPENYPNNIRCMWTIKSNMSSPRIEINFDHMEIQDPNANDVCEFDVLEIKETSNLHSISEGLGENFVFTGPKPIISSSGVQLPVSSYKYCGTGQPPSYHSARYDLLITFKSDGSYTKKGFKLHYRYVECNRNYTAVQGRIVNEGQKTDCYIKITAKENQTISLYFQSFFISDRSGCLVNGLKIYDGNSTAATLLANICGFKNYNPIYSTGNELLIMSKSIQRYMALYDIIYTTTDQGRGCGGVLFNYQGKFTSPMYPQNFRNNSVCRWDISVPRGMLVTLKFTLFDLGTVNTCPTDYVELFDKDLVSGDETLRTTYCAGDTPAIFVGTSNNMVLRYTTSFNNAGSGWFALFSAKDKNPE